MTGIMPLIPWMNEFKHLIDPLGGDTDLQVAPGGSSVAG